MATKLYTGMDGALMFARGASTALTWDTCAKVRGWSFTANLNTLDITSIGDVITQNAPGIASYSGNATILYYQRGGTSAAPYNDAGIFLQTLMVSPGSTGDGRVYPGNSTTKTHDDYTKLRLNLSNGDASPGTSLDRFIELECLITSASITVQTGDVVTSQISFVNRTKLTTVKLGVAL